MKLSLPEYDAAAGSASSERWLSVCNAREQARVISDQCGQQITARQVGFSEPPHVGSGATEEEDHRHDAMLRLFDHYGRFGITGNSNVLSRLLGSPPTSFAEYVRRSQDSR